MLFKEHKTLLEGNETWIFSRINLITAPFRGWGVVGGASPVVVRGLLIEAASLLGSMGSRELGLQELWLTDLVTP